MRLSLADYLTSLRILFILPLSVAIYYDWWAITLVLYLTIPLTDLLDGYFARRSQSPTLGASFDAIADLAFGIAVVSWVFWRAPEQRPFFPLYLSVLLTLVFIYFGISFWKTRKILLLHLWSGKLAGWVGYLWFIFTFYTDQGAWAIHAAAAVSIFFYLESSVYLLRGRTDEDGKSAIF